jgi:hypothetical protein
VHPAFGLADFDRSDDIRVLHALTVARFPQKSFDRGAILTEFFAQHFDGNGAVIGMLRAEDSGGSALTDFALKRISGDGLSDEVFAWHAAKLTRQKGCGKEAAEASALDGRRLDAHVMKMIVAFMQRHARAGRVATMPSRTLKSGLHHVVDFLTNAHCVPI